MQEPTDTKPVHTAIALDRHEAAFRRATNIKFELPAALLSPRVQSRDGAKRKHYVTTT